LLKSGDTVGFASDKKFAIANFNPLMPMPGTKLYSRLKEEGRLVHECWWLDDEYRYGDVMFEPKGMTARYEFNSLASIARRMVNFRANSSSLSSTVMYLMANFISRREIIRKQGQFLGGNLGRGETHGIEGRCV
jgi:radical SAM superfamily enzyme YgiQ (UPF0313 family)